jgi:hypothetical protein
MELLMVCDACQASIRTSDPAKQVAFYGDHAECGLEDQ